MAQEIVIWCDLHLANDERVNASPHQIAFDGTEYKIDLCPECYKLRIQSLLDSVAAVANPVKSARKQQPPAHEGGVKRGRKFTADTKIVLCPLCDVEYSASSVNQHLTVIHHVTATELFGERCPLCAEVKDGATGLSLHGRRAHDVTGAVGLFALAAEQGDPHGIVAERITPHRVV